MGVNFLVEEANGSGSVLNSDSGVVLGGIGDLKVIDESFQVVGSSR
jgi:hypothetical protein